MISREKFVALDEKIRQAERALVALKRKRAGFDNGHGWRYCECGATNQLLASPVECRGCDELKAERMVLAHDAGEHAICPERLCLGCYRPERASGARY